jgi:hypothetical protein
MALNYRGLEVYGTENGGGKVSSEVVYCDLSSAVVLSNSQ